MTDLPGLLSTGLAVLTLATGVGLGLMRGVLTNLREQLADCRREGEELRRQRDELRTTLGTLAAEVEALGKQVRGERYWTALATGLDTHHDEAVAHWTRSEELDHRIITALGEIRDRSH